MTSEQSYHWDEWAKGEIEEQQLAGLRYGARLNQHGAGQGQDGMLRSGSGGGQTVEENGSGGSGVERAECPADH